MNMTHSADIRHALSERVPAQSQLTDDEAQCCVLVRALIEELPEYYQRRDGLSASDRQLLMILEMAQGHTVLRTQEVIERLRQDGPANHRMVSAILRALGVVRPRGPAPEAGYCNGPVWEAAKK